MSNYLILIPLFMSEKIRIDKIIPGGNGLGRLADGMVSMVRFVLPGELVQVAEIKRNRGFVEAGLVKVLEPAPDRIQAPCQYYQNCGGCDLQHSTYQRQTKIKSEILVETFQRAKVDSIVQTLRPLHTAPNIFGYRHRIRLKVSKKGEVGFFRYRSNKIVVIDRCEIAMEPINGVLKELKTAPDALRALFRFCREVEILISPLDGKVILLIRVEKKQYRKVQKIGDTLCLESVDHIFLQVEKNIYLLAGEKQEELLGCDFPWNGKRKDYTLYWRPDCFSQVNPEQNRTLVKIAIDCLGAMQGKSVLDLYCGTGNFSIPAAKAGTNGLGIESNPESIRWAKKNAAAAKVSGWTFKAADVNTELSALIKKNEQFDSVILDPPRAGIGKSAQLLADLGPRQIVYISCDPVTLARDVKLLEERGYRLISIIPVDMFPQTHHIESVAHLKKIDISASSH